MDSWWNTAPESSTTNLTTRHGGGDVPGDGRGLDRRRVIGRQDPRLQSSDWCADSDAGWLSGRGLGRLAGREGIVVLTFAEEEEHELWVRWMGTGNLISCEWRM